MFTKKKNNKISSNIRKNHFVIPKILDFNKIADKAAEKIADVFENFLFNILQDKEDIRLSEISYNQNGIEAIFPSEYKTSVKDRLIEALGNSQELRWKLSDYTNTGGWVVLKIDDGYVLNKIYENEQCENTCDLGICYKK